MEGLIALLKNHKTSERKNRLEPMHGPGTYIPNHYATLPLSVAM